MPPGPEPRVLIRVGLFMVRVVTEQPCEEATGTVLDLIKLEHFNP